MRMPSQHHFTIRLNTTCQLSHGLSNVFREVRDKAIVEIHQRGRCRDYLPTFTTMGFAVRRRKYGIHFGDNGKHRPYISVGRLHGRRSKCQYAINV